MCGAGGAACYGEAGGHREWLTDATSNASELRGAGCVCFFTSVSLCRCAGCVCFFTSLRLHWSICIGQCKSREHISSSTFDTNIFHLLNMSHPQYFQCPTLPDPCRFFNSDDLVPSSQFLVLLTHLGPDRLPLFAFEHSCESGASY